MSQLLEPIPGLPSYSVTDTGRILGPRGWRRTRPDKDGYERFNAWKDGKIQVFLVHRCVIEAFFGPRPKGMEVRHLDGNRCNNDIANLRYGTRQENSDDAVRHGALSSGESHYNAKLTADDVRDIRRKIGAGLSDREIFADYDGKIRSAASIWWIRKGSYWRSVQ